jgi:Chaperone of endosialidase
MYSSRVREARGKTALPTGHVISDVHVFVRKVGRAFVDSFMKTSTLFTNYIHSSLGRSLLCVPIVIGCFASSPMARAVVPAPDGGYPGGNTAEGQAALLALTSGTFNTAVGFFALLNNTSGSYNTALGAGTLIANTTAQENTATGTGALLSNTSGSENTANGAFALFSNTIGFQNTAIGDRALFVNNGDFNTAIGKNALQANVDGNENTATGVDALFSNTTGIDNTANGLGALHNNTTGGANTALGLSAGFNATTGSNNVYIGAGMMGVAGESNACYIASIFGRTSADGVAVLINSDNKLGTATSSKRFKEDIKPMDKASEAILALKPVSFRYKKEIDSRGIPQFGLVAEEVEKVNPDLVVRDKEGKPYTVRYDQVNAMLLNEFLKEHRTVEELKKEVAALTAGLRKVSAQLELGKPKPQMVLNDQ